MNENKSTQNKRNQEENGLSEINFMMRNDENGINNDKKEHSQIHTQNFSLLLHDSYSFYMQIW